MPTLYPLAAYKPLGSQTQPRLVNPSAIILHTMDGYLHGTDATFRPNGYHGDESHFGVGGPADGQSFDGAVWQWQDLDYTADAQYSGNSYGISIETSDGGQPNTPWSPKQLESITSLVIWLCQKYNLPPVLMAHSTDKGIGFHSQFHEWNLDAHNCPGGTRAAQLILDVIPAVKARITIPQPIPVGDELPSVEDVLNGLDAAMTSTLAGTPVPGTKFIDGLAKRILEFQAQQAGK